jgi:predicted  nucleic acid-binding Zn-ribbon protein
MGMDQDAADLYERLRITLERADGGRVKIADEIEYVLTEGYAYALNLELRPQRIEKRIVQLVTSGETDSDELRKLAREKLDTDRELVTLRGTLAQLQEYCDELKEEGRVAMPERELVRPAEPPDST